MSDSESSYHSDGDHDKAGSDSEVSGMVQC